MAAPIDWTDLVARTRVLIATCDPYNADEEPPDILAEALRDCLALLGEIADYAETFNRAGNRGT